MIFDDTESESSDSFMDNFINDYVFDDSDIKVVEIVNPRIMSVPKEPILKSNYWAEVFSTLTDSSFKGRYRRSKSSFNAMVNEYYDVEIYKSTDIWTKILAMTLDYISSGSRIKDIMMLYDVAHGKAQTDIEGCIKFINTNVLPNVCQWPDENARDQLAAYNWRRYSLPLCIGSIDGTLVKIKGFQPNRQELNSRKHHFAFNVLLVCNYHGTVIHYVVDSPGSMADVSIYEESDMFNNLTDWLRNANRRTHPYYVLSDKGIPNSDYVITPFADNGMLTDKQKTFNNYIQSGRSVIERVNGIIKQRYQIIEGTMKACSEKKAKEIIKACIALYNDEIVRGDLILYREKIELNETDVMDMFSEYYESPYIDVFSGSRGYLYDFIEKLG